MASGPTSTDEINLFDPAHAACPHANYRRLVDEQPVIRAPLTNSPIISRYGDVVFALRHPEIFSSEMSKQMGLGTERPMIPQQIDPPAQTRYRKILDPQFSRKRVTALEPAIRAGATALIDGFVKDGECEFNRAFAIPLPCNAFLHLMGLPLEDLDLFLEMKDGIIRPHAKTDDLEEIAKIRAEAGGQIYAYFERVIEERRGAPRDDMIGDFLSSKIGGKELSNNEVLDICFLFLLGGLDTMTATLGCSIAYLAANPDQRHKIVEDPDCIDSAVEELLRWETPVTAVPRVMKKDFEVAGTKLLQGEVVMLLLGAANLDPAEFENADTMDLERERNRQLAFGSGPHRCLGSHLARMELRIALEEWHRRIPDYEIKAGETPIYSARIREVQYLPISWG
ncbi:MAG: cytochrome P450 [bacterium]|nr:cytochrome P450 [bacterium]